MTAAGSFDKCTAMMQITTKNNTQSQIADFAPLLPSGELYETFTPSLILAHSFHHVKA